MSTAIIVSRYGGPEVLVPQDIPVGAPGPGQVRIRSTAIGINYHDIYVRSGLYHTLALPGIPGLEGVGVVEAIGPDVTNLAAGDRVGYLDTGYGAYASHRLLGVDLAIRLPDTVDDDLAAATLLKGLTAGALVTGAHRLTGDETILIHAAAGGVGHLLVQWASHLGARVIGTVGSREKVDLALAAGCVEVLVTSVDDVAARATELTHGRGVDVVYDAVGAATFDASLAALAVRGHLVNFGQSSGPIPPFDIARLAPKSATITRAGYSHYLPDMPARRAMAARFFDLVARGAIKARPPQQVPLARAAEAHAALEARALGPFVLIP